ncbi:MAG TPA: 2-oxo-4-hydroxy-4-carboxy-5-ureidoimidazoline decarboxylase [Bryobacteraceae bacterium]|jgi:2-oxo-4-hydroxy-4-carboxy-5-ureidoimidazoline decarboxylase|nr:2-oxo-4-hydroxy-4-carboxy-5-ureidoimidazoline decarboxylase [Bryobacteraceae bacterium]
MTIEAINSMPRAAFVEALGWVFEHSPWVAERAWERRPFANIDALHSAMRDEVERATRDEQLALLRAHPDLGTRLRVSAASQSEQAGAGFDQLEPGLFEHLQHLNSEYREKFGFPFIYAVKGSSQEDILGDLIIRMDSTAEQAVQEALYEVYRIAYFRLEQIFDNRS